MNAEFASIRNHHERTIFDAVVAMSSRYPMISGDPDLLADVACVALNRMPPRYIRHEVDLTFYLTEKERVEVARSVDESVSFAFEFVQARRAMRARL